jgi:hypothetical protein
MSFSRAIRRRTSRATDRKYAWPSRQKWVVFTSTWISCPSRWRCRPTKVKHS